MFGRRRGYRRGFGRGGGGGLGLMLLAMQLLPLFQFLSNSNEYYPISLGVLGLNLVAFFQPGSNWPSIREACISVQGAWFDRQWKRMFLSSFYHTSDFHLYYNMASFIWKAISLERHFGSGYFLYMVAVFSVTTNLVYMAINYALAVYLDQWSYIHSCAAGFSGVLFALKVITTHIQPAGMTRVLGFIPVPMRIACWVELVLISVLFPHVSFVGHLAGIIVGFAFVYGPLRVVMDIPLSLITGTIRSLEMGSLEGSLPDSYRRVAIVTVGLFMILFPILLDLVPSGTGTEGTHRQNSYNGRSYTYTAGTTGIRHRTEQQQTTQLPSRRADTTSREYHSYTYAAGTSGQSEGAQLGEDAALQEAIRRSLSSESGVRADGERAEGERSTEGDDLSSEDTQAAIERSVSHREGSPAEPLDTSRPPPYNPQFPLESSGDHTAVPHSNVGWNRDLLDDQPDTMSRPIGFDALQSEPASIPTGSMGTELYHRRNRTEPSDGSDTPTADSHGSTDDPVSSSSLTRQEMRQARLLRFGGSEAERRPLSELSSHSFSFKK